MVADPTSPDKIDAWVPSYADDYADPNDRPALYYYTESEGNYYLWTLSMTVNIQDPAGAFTFAGYPFGGLPPVSGVAGVNITYKERVYSVR
jgi:hypothetical protein